LPIEDPTDFLASRVTETPFLSERRTCVVKAFTEQRSVAAGMTGLLSGAINLESHQIEVVRRVLQDPVQRYLLADEVGLGKTIEAGIIIRQFVLDDPADHEVFIAVPDHLTDQWREELTQKFFLGDLLDKSIQIVPFNQIEQVLKAPRMLVVDEAHQLAALAVSAANSIQRRRFEHIRVAATKAERLLLLSATPSLHNDTSFQAMLHLLDPIVYPLGDLAAFRARRESHQRVAELFHVFHATESGTFLKDCLDDMISLFPGDDRLRNLGEQLRPLLGYGLDPTDEKRADLVQEIRVHVSEAYRLHRRLLRHRRADESIEKIVPGREGLVRWPYHDSALEPISAVLDEWRTMASSYAVQQPSARDQLAECLQLLLDAAFDPLSLKAITDIRRGIADEDEVAGLALTAAEYTILTATPPLPDEADLLRRLDDVVASTENLDRADATAGGIGRWWSPDTDRHVVVFATFPRAADEVYDTLRVKWGDAVLRHGRTGWERFRRNAKGLILVCDRCAEEGLNLQGTHAALVHYDLPMSPNRIEQRLGRLDRYGVGRFIRSMTPSPVGGQFAQAWCEVLDGTFRVFERSIAALQYLVEAEWSGFRSNLLFEGLDGLKEFAIRLGGDGGLVENTLRQIQVLDELNCIETTMAQQDFALALVETELLKSVSWRAAFRDYVVSRLKFREVCEPNSRGEVVRYQFQRPFQGGDTTLVPVGRFVERFAHVIDRIRTERRPLEPISKQMTFLRERALLTATPLARLGHPFVDAMIEHLRRDDSGRAFGLWRVRPARVPSNPPADVAFRFDYLIEARIDNALAAVPSGSEATRQSMRRFADRLLLPDFFTIWVTDRGELISDPSELAAFEEPYQKGIMTQGIDRNLNPDNWRTIEPFFPPGDWGEITKHAKSAADRGLQRLLHSSIRLTERVDLARSEAEVRQSQFQSRVAFLPPGEREIELKRAEEDVRLWAALIDGIAKPAVHLEALGAVFLSNEDPFAEGGDNG